LFPFEHKVDASESSCYALMPDSAIDAAPFASADCFSVTL